MVAKFDAVKAAEEKNAIVAVEDAEREQTLESEIPAWIREGAIVEARVVADDLAICCAPSRLPKPGVPYAVRATATSITVAWDVGAIARAGACPPVE